MNKNLKRIAALLLAIAMIASFAACKNDKNNNDTTAAGDVAINGDAIADDLLPEASSEAASDDTAVETEIVTDKEGHTVIEAKAPADNSAKPSNGKPESYAEILSAYRDVLNLAKSSKVGYEKSEWQTLPKDKRNFDGFVINAALPVAELFMTSEKDAKGKKHENNPKGTDMKWFPIYQHPTKGCTLTDVSKIKSAKCEVLSNGNYKITIVLKADINPEPCDPKTGVISKGFTGTMFSPLAKADIDNTLQNDPNVTKVVKDVEYSLKYYDCTAVLTYNPKTNHMVDLYQYMHVLITGSGKVLGSKFNGSAVLDNFLEITNVKY